jgi:hypothetical protein
MKPKLILLLLIAVLLTACTATPVNVAECASGEAAGFWEGLWHGIIAPFTFIISLFSDKVEMYEVFNNGNWYNFGFVLGASIIFGGSGHQGRGIGKGRREA